MKRLLSFTVVALALTLGSGTPAFADPGQVPDPPATTDEFFPGKACAHANLVANRNFNSNHATGVKDGNGTPPKCFDGGGGGGG